MANAAFDLISVTGDFGLLGPEDLKLYTDAAILGLNKSKAFNAIYGDYTRRMPVMFGFNFPMFKILDRLAIEAEWYGAKFKGDLVRYQASSSSYISPLPVFDATNADQSRGNWMWSVYGSRTFGNIRIIFQVANDHSRPGDLLLFAGSEWQALYSTLKDWYWMTKMAFFF